jgi:hypothetical protein
MDPIQFTLVDLVELVKTIGGFLSALAIIAGALGACSKKVRAWFGRKIRDASGIEALKEDVKKIKTNQETLSDNLKGHLSQSDARFENGENRISNNEQLMVAMLRDILTRVYHQNYQTKSLPPYGKQYICHMYEDYKNRGGNSYVKSIYEEMMEWEERS